MAWSMPWLFAPQWSMSAFAPCPCCFHVSKRRSGWSFGNTMIEAKNSTQHDILWYIWIYNIWYIIHIMIVIPVIWSWYITYYSTLLHCNKKLIFKDLPRNPCGSCFQPVAKTSLEVTRSWATCSKSPYSFIPTSPGLSSGDFSGLKITKNTVDMMWNNHWYIEHYKITKKKQLGWSEARNLLRIFHFLPFWTLGTVTSLFGTWKFGPLSREVCVSGDPVSWWLGTSH